MDRGDDQYRDEDHESPRRQPANDPGFVEMDDVVWWLDSGGTKMDDAQEDRTPSTEEGPVARTNDAPSIENKAEQDERVDAEAIGEGGGLWLERPANVVAPNDVVEVVAQGHQRRQGDQPVDGSLPHAMFLPMEISPVMAIRRDCAHPRSFLHACLHRARSGDHPWQ